jgi:HSP20 family molecular chaperone IbpA
MNDKVKLTPCACFSHDETGGRLKIQVEMPGASKNDIKLDMRSDSFCLSAPRGDDAEYSSCFMLSHEVDPGKTEAKYENGLLRILSPIKGWEDKVSVQIQ